VEKTLLVIPARWGSTRFPGKPLHEIAGKPLLRRVWERCQRAHQIDRVIVATDDRRILEAANGWGAEAVMTSRKHTSGTDRVAEVAARHRDFSFIINVQGDEPLLDPRLLDRFVSVLKTTREIGLVTAAHAFSDPADAHSPHQVKVVTDRASRALYFSRAPIPFIREKNSSGKILRHQGVYGFRRDVLLQFVKWNLAPLERAESLEQLRALENGVRVHVLITKHGSPGVDTPADAAALERTLSPRVESARPLAGGATRRFRLARRPGSSKEARP
jgi:3-deoxy-manno-octulosonate cytidylyltransferase (CMP-KDO synthetase)